MDTSSTDKSDSTQPARDAAPPLSMATAPAVSLRSQKPAEADTCRICRGEGAPDEPLFYPCKCSGSIRYVHQDCLLEWLSHSQKKYCELCKTPFRFTKLYSPMMPRSIPVHILLGHLATHVFRKALAHLRAALVISVWLVWLPYLMRSVWAFCFWVSDEGFVTQLSPTRSTPTLLQEWPECGFLPQTCASSPLFVTQATNVSETIGSDLFRGQDEWAAVAGKDPISKAMVGLLATNIRKVLGTNSSTLLDHYANAAMDYGATRESLLSDVTWLRNLTRSPMLNYTAVIVLEGQIITLSVVVCFVLAILVRDYVVLQQPDINARAALEERAGADVDNVAADAAEIGEPADPGYTNPAPALVQAVGDEARLHDTLGAGTETHAGDLHAKGSGPAIRGSPQMSAKLPTKDSLDFSGQVRQFEAPPEEFVQLWNEASSNAHAFLQLVEERDLDHRMRPWTVLARLLIATRSQTVIEADGTHWQQDSATQTHAIFTDVDSVMEFVRVIGPPLHLQLPGEVGYTSDQEKVPHAALLGKGQGTPPADEDAAWDADAKKPQPAPVLPRSNFERDPAHRWTDGSARDSQIVDGIHQGNPTSPTGSGGTTSFLNTPDATTSGPSQSTVKTAPGRQDIVPQPLSSPRPNPAQLYRDEEPHDIPLMPEASNMVSLAAQAMPRDEETPEPAADDGRATEVAQPPDLAADAVQEDGPDAAEVEDLEDFEGVMELLGMRGPLVALFQNAVFCAVLVSVTIFFFIIGPYNIGRVALWVLANPTSLIRLLFEASAFVQDFVIMTTAFVWWMCVDVLWILMAALGAPNTPLRPQADQAWRVLLAATSTMGETITSNLASSASDVRNFSALSHLALLQLKELVGHAFAMSSYAVSTMATSGIINQLPVIMAYVRIYTASVLSIVKAIPSAAMNPSSWVITMETLASASPPPELAVWSGYDRTLAIMCGYLTMFTLATLYLRRGAPLASSQVGQQWEALITDSLQQASGVLKVILVIGIEMLLFPLYCGLLLDMALLPLFEGASIQSRIAFTYSSPVTSIIVHWFVGTGYMFHFAMFVAMCRKVLRKGALYFIRDPDDADFHPVREVLERHLLAQLRKILFSALVYGTLVVACLGGVVWGLHCTTSLLPIHYSSHEPVLEFPIDLLFCNLVLPLAVRFFKPSDRLHAMYTWWFRTCGRALRMSWFLFGERHIDEEGTLVLRSDSLHYKLPWWRKIFLVVDGAEVKPMSWNLSPENGHKLPSLPLKTAAFIASENTKQELIRTGQLIQSGRLVRTPATDKMSIQRGAPFFQSADDVELAVAKGEVSTLSPDTFESPDFQLTYKPPHFGTRVFLFFIFVWLFAAFTGLCMTIIPLIFGRRLFAALLPPGMPSNDIYAFSLGVCVLGTAAHVAYSARDLAAEARSQLSDALAPWLARNLSAKVYSMIVRVGGLVYAYATLLVVLPLIVATLLELYVMLPLHTLLDRPWNQEVTAEVSGPVLTDPTVGGTHTVRAIQVWTLGVLCLMLGARVVVDYYAGTWPATAIVGVMAQGMLQPNLEILTRMFLLPGLALGGLATFGPVLVARSLLSCGVLAQYGRSPASLTVLYRLSYPAATAVLFMGWMARRSIIVFNRWTMKIRDEAYLIGERLHNYGTVSASPSRRAQADWRATGSVP